MKCRTCGAKGFAPSKAFPDACEFCDGTFGGNPPTEQDIADAKAARERGQEAQP